MPVEQLTRNTCTSDLDKTALNLLQFHSWNSLHFMLWACNVHNSMHKWIVASLVSDFLRFPKGGWVFPLSPLPGQVTIVVVTGMARSSCCSFPLQFGGSIDSLHVYLLSVHECLWQLLVSCVMVMVTLQSCELLGSIIPSTCLVWGYVATLATVFLVRHYDKPGISHYAVHKVTKC